MKFRAIVLHVKDSEDYASYSDSLRRVANRLDAFTLRAVLREPSDEVDLELKAVYAGEGSKAFDKAWDLLSKGYFTSVSLGSDPYSAPLNHAAEFIARISEELGPEYNTMLAITTGTPPEGPYFPATRANGLGISASLLYPSDLYGALYEAEEPDAVIRHVMSLIFQQAEESLLQAMEEDGGDLPYLGIDFSLSPWMEESSAKVISLVARAPFLAPGTASAILEVNRAIREVSMGLKSIGFGEVMLPMAEDDLLKEMVLEGTLTARDLVSLTPYCVTGLDMVALPLSTPVRELAKLIGDVLAASSVKRNVLGVRIILVDAEPGEEVELGRFGKVPVMSLG